jgi:shikimate kinase
VDLDDLIELREKKAIADIFAAQGEAYFRRLESRILKEVAKEKDFIVACGGGIVINKDNITLMKETGNLLCLSATPEIILKRTQPFRHRPLLNVSNPQQKVELLLKLRAPFYALADKCIDTSKLSVKQVVDKVLKVVDAGKKSRTPRDKGAGMRVC